MEQTLVLAETGQTGNTLKSRFSTQVIKGIISAVVSLLCIVCLLAGGIIGRELSDIGEKGMFTGIAVIGALFNGGELSFSYYVDGEPVPVVSYLPFGMNVLLVLVLALFLFLFLYQTIAVVFSWKKGEERGAVFNRAGGIATVVLGFIAFAVYILLITVSVQTTCLKLAGLEYEPVEAKFYEVFSPSVSWMIIGVVAIICGLVQIKIDANQVVLLKRYIPSYVFMIVPLVLIAVFNLYPIVLQTILSFKDYSLGTGVFNSAWVGFQNFGLIFGDPEMLRVIGNTLYISLLRLVGSTIPPLLLSIFLYDMRMMRARKVVQTVVYIPHFFSWVIIYAITYAFLNEEGIVNMWTGSSSSILTNPDAFIPIVIITAIWKELGWGTILYLAALSSVPPELFEAAKLDGAGPWQRVVHITLPNIMPIVIYLLIMNLGQILKNAGGEQLLLFANAVTRPQALVIDTWLYWESLGELKYSLGAAMSFFQAGIGMILVFGCNYLSRKTTGIGMW